MGKMRLHRFVHFQPYHCIWKREKWLKNTFSAFFHCPFSGAIKLTWSKLPFLFLCPELEAHEMWLTEQCCKFLCGRNAQPGFAGVYFLGAVVLSNTFVAVVLWPAGIAHTWVPPGWAWKDGACSWYELFRLEKRRCAGIDSTISLSGSVWFSSQNIFIENPRNSIIKVNQ